MYYNDDASDWGLGTSVKVKRAFAADGTEVTYTTTVEDNYEGEWADNGLSFDMVL